MIHLLEEAESDLVNGGFFHEDRSEGLGSYFVDCLSSDIGSLKLFAGTHSKKYEKHRLLSKRFPYSVYYDIVNGETIVFGVFSDRMHPDLIRSALESRNP